MTEIDTTDVQTQIGTKVLETPYEVRNPVTGERERMRDLSEDGYKRRFLALKHQMSGDTINLSNTPVMSFDKDRWEVVEKENTVFVRKREPESALGEMVDR